MRAPGRFLLVRPGTVLRRLREARDPGSRRLVRRVRTRVRRIALSFDDGPSDATESILDLLREHGATATFFVIGKSIQGREEVVRRIAREGHELGNHTWSHVVVSRLGDEELLDELRRTNAEVEAVADRTPTLMRPPFFDDAARAARLAGQVGLMRTVLGYFAHDWEWPSADRIAQRVVDWARPGEIVVLHDGRGGGTSADVPCATTVAAVKIVLPELRRRGFEIVSVSELLDSATQSGTRALAGADRAPLNRLGRFLEHRLGARRLDHVREDLLERLRRRPADRA